MANRASPDTDAAWARARRMNGDGAHGRLGSRPAGVAGDAPEPDGGFTPPMVGGWCDAPTGGSAPRHLVLVAEAADGDDAGRAGGIQLHLRAEALDVHVQRLGVADVV